MQVSFPTRVNTKRVRLLSKQKEIANNSSVIYWMSRDQRVHDNWAFLFAQDIAVATNSQLTVVFTLNPNFLGATLRQYDFMLQGLKEIADQLRKLNIPFKLLSGDVEEIIVNYVNKENITTVVTDFSPLKISRKWKQTLVKQTTASIYEVDAHNIVPAWIVSDKQEYSARTFRPKIHKQLKEFLTPFPKVKTFKKSNLKVENQISWKTVTKNLKIDTSVHPILWLKPGESNAYNYFQSFLTNRISEYEKERNDPTQDALSNLSPYLHFGHIAAQYIAIHSQEYEAFFEELVVRRELAENYCFYNQNYDSFLGFPSWAQATLKKHSQDKRKYLYTVKQLEFAQTHDSAWNAAQLEMLIKGKMHGYMRMYWAKKILEWTKNPQQAVKIAIYLNDKYELDGRDPNGYTGIAWSIGGVHDRGWTERAIFGKIRYMNFKGLQRKFDIEKYINKFLANANL